MERGLRQGDPLSPFLFIIVAEALQVSIPEACGRGIFSGLSLANDVANLSLLQYADDALIFSKWSRLNVKNLVRILGWYQDASGLKVNLSKSRLYGIGVDLSEVIDVANSVNCSHDNLPFCYLGLPSPVLQSFENGGLGIGSIKAKNLSLLGKWWWRFHNEKEALWCKVITCLYGNDGGFNSGVDSFVRNVKSGVDVFFWHDFWLGAGLCLKDHFPRLYALETYKECRMKDRWISVNGTWSYNWDWRSNTKGRALDDINELSQLIGNLVLYPGYNDWWKWELDPGGVFTVNKLSKLLDSSMLGLNVMTVNVDWNSWVPKKVNIRVWRALNNRLSTLSNLEARGVPVWKFNPPDFSSLHELLEFVPPLSSLAKKVFQRVVYVVIWALWDWRNRVLHTSSSCLHEDIFAKVLIIRGTAIGHCKTRELEIVVYNSILVNYSEDPKFGTRPLMWYAPKAALILMENQGQKTSETIDERIYAFLLASKTVVAISCRDLGARIGLSHIPDPRLARLEAPYDCNNGVGGWIYCKWSLQIQEMSINCTFYLQKVVDRLPISIGTTVTGTTAVKVPIKGRVHPIKDQVAEYRLRGNNVVRHCSRQAIPLEFCYGNARSRIVPEFALTKQ
ncbi:RNA-directed DNA polymerase, eukaryota, reverse transcriptase zinc-binding domain protein [Tanacetum coccineum]